MMFMMYIYFFQQKETEDYGILAQDANTDVEEVVIPKLPLTSDMFLMFSTAEGIVVYQA